MKSPDSVCVYNLWDLVAFNAYGTVWDSYGGAL